MERKDEDEEKEGLKVTPPSGLCLIEHAGK